EAPLGLAVGMAHLMPDLPGFAGQLATPRHGSNPLKALSLKPSRVRRQKAALRRKAAGAIVIALQRVKRVCRMRNGRGRRHGKRPKHTNDAFSDKTIVPDCAIGRGGKLGIFEGFAALPIELPRSPRNRRRRADWPRRFHPQRAIGPRYWA